MVLAVGQVKRSDRMYDTPAGFLPSVTNILKYTSTGLNSGLDGAMWWASTEAASTAVELRRKERVSDKVFQRSVQLAHIRTRDTAVSLGVSAHAMLGRVLLDIEGSSRERAAVSPFRESIEDFKVKFSPTQVNLDVAVYDPELGYAGSADIVCQLDGESFPTVLEVKTSKQLRLSHALQVAAYATASHGWVGIIEEGLRPAARLLRLSEEGSFQLTAQLDLEFLRLFFSRLCEVHKSLQGAGSLVRSL